MSTFLQLCQKTARECDVAGTGPTTVVGQTGDLADIVRWVADSYVDIQNRNNAHWRWLRHGFTIAATSGDGKYAPSDAVDDDTALAIASFSSWRIEDLQDPPKAFLTSAGVGAEYWLSFTRWEYFKQIYEIGTQTNSQPAHISVDPQDNIRLGPKPNDSYTISGEYWRSAQILALDADVPDMPPQFHDLIVWYAVDNYGYKEAAPEVIERAHKRMKRLMRALEGNQMEKFRMARALA